MGGSGGLCLCMVVGLLQFCVCVWWWVFILYFFYINVFLVFLYIILMYRIEK